MLPSYADRLSADGLEFRWPQGELQTKDTNGEWVRVGDATNGGEITIPIDPNVPRQFYRVKVNPP